MSFRLFNFRFACALVLFAACAWATGVLRAADGPVSKDRSIHFSDPQNDSVNTNLNQLARPNASKNLDEFSKPEPSFMSPSSLNGVMIGPLPRPAGGTVIQSKRARESEDRRKNWAFSEPEDLLSSVTVEELLNVPEYGADGKEKKPASALERFLSRPFNGATNGFRNGNFWGSSNRWSDGALPSDNPDSAADSSKKKDGLFSSSFDSSLFPATGNAGGFSDMFGKDDHLQSERLRREQQARLDQFKQLMDSQMQPAPIVKSTLNPQNGTSDSSRRTPGLSDWSSYSSSSQSKTFDPLFGTINPSLTPAAPSSFMNPQMPGVPGLSPALPALTPTRQAPPLPTVFSLPQRKF